MARSIGIPLAATTTATRVTAGFGRILAFRSIVQLVGLDNRGRSGSGCALDDVVHMLADARSAHESEA